MELTAREFDLLELLMRHPNRVYSREQLLNLVWGYEYTPGVPDGGCPHPPHSGEGGGRPGQPHPPVYQVGVGYYFHGN